MVVTSTFWCVILQGYWWEILVPYLLIFTIALMLICFHELNKYGRYTYFIKINTSLPYPKRPDRHPIPQEIYTKTTTVIFLYQFSCFTWSVTCINRSINTYWNHPALIKNHNNCTYTIPVFLSSQIVLYFKHIYCLKTLKTVWLFCLWTLIPSV